MERIHLETTIQYKASFQKIYRLQTFSVSFSVSPGSSTITIVQETRNGFGRLDGWFHGRWNIAASGGFFRRGGELGRDSFVTVPLSTPDTGINAFAIVGFGIALANARSLAFVVSQLVVKVARSESTKGFCPNLRRAYHGRNSCSKQDFKRISSIEIPFLWVCACPTRRWIRGKLQTTNSQTINCGDEQGQDQESL